MREESYIAKYIHNLKSIGEEDVERIASELSKSPWCATYKVLLAKGYDNTDSFLKKKLLRQAATYVGDRERLFALMQDSRAETIEVVVEHSKEIELLPESSETTGDMPNEPINVEEGIIASVEENSPAENIDELALEFDAEITEGSKEVEESPEKNKINFDEIVVYDPIKELQAVEPPPRGVDRVEIPFDYVAYNPEKELTKLIEEKDIAKKADEQDFLSWLNTVGDKKARNEIGSVKSPDKVQTLLDQFLATKRSRPIQNRTFYNAQNKAEESEEDNMDVVSESLIGLYVKQGHFEKAVKGYRKLSLLYPKKSAYFAALIKETQKKQNNT